VSKSAWNGFDETVHLQDVVRDAVYHQLRQHLRSTIGKEQNQRPGVEGSEESPALQDNAERLGVVIEDITEEGEPMEIDCPMEQ